MLPASSIVTHKRAEEYIIYEAVVFATVSTRMVLIYQSRGLHHAFSQNGVPRAPMTAVAVRNSQNGASHYTNQGVSA